MHLIFEYYVHALIFENFHALYCVTQAYTSHDCTAGENNIDMTVLTYSDHITSICP